MAHKDRDNAEEKMKGDFNHTYVNHLIRLVVGLFDQ